MKKVATEETSEPDKLKLPTFQCAIGMGIHAVNVFSEKEDFICYFEGRGAGYIPWIPGWWTKRSYAQTRYSMVYFPEGNPHFEYDGRNRRLIISGDMREFRDGQALAYLGFWLMELQRQRDFMFTSHATALSMEDKGVLIFGERGDGKTSVALSLGRTYGYKLIANDLAIIGYDDENEQLALHNGTKIFGLRLSAIRGRFPELLHLFPDQTQRSWITKAFVYPDKVGIATEMHPKSLTRAFMVHLDNTKTDKLSAQEMNDLWVRNYLYENFSRYIRGTAIVAFGESNLDFLDYMPSLDDRGCHENRLKIIRFLIEKIKILNVSSGSLEEIRDFIHTSVSQ